MSNAISSWAFLKDGIPNLMALLISLAIVLTTMAPRAFAQTELAIEHRLPLTTAMEAATTAITTCASQGAAVSASVVDQHGQTLLQLRGDLSAPHTYGLSRQKAYTAVSLAPIQGVTSTSEVSARLRSTNQAIGELALPSSPIPGIIGVPGGIIIKTEANELLGALGVSGASSGLQDEKCVYAGLDAIKESLGKD
jgi:uncharacterized protein GlcG (DUF336 family)